MNIQNNDIVNHGAAIVIYRCRVACVCVSYYFLSFIDMQRRDRDHEDKLNWDQHTVNCTHLYGDRDIGIIYT